MMADHSSAVSTTQAKEKDECEICDLIWCGFTKDDRVSIKLGSRDEALSNDCLGHKPFVEALIRSYHTFWKKSQDMISAREKDVKLSFWSRQAETSLSKYKKEIVRLVKKDDVPRHPGRCVVLDPSWVDIGTIKEWKRTCLVEHGMECQNPTKVWSIRPAWLINVVDQCLVPGSVATDAEFVALSYTYGNQPGLKIDAATLSKLLRPGSLNSSEFAERVAPMIKHAIYLTRAIGEHYLWADALCISQIDQGERKRELESMGAIYANAVVVIIAADGVAKDGLLGLKDVSEPRNFKQKLVPLRGTESVVFRETPTSEVTSGAGPYYKRGWTHQEMLFAKRKIYFYDHQVHWECQSGLWHEEAPFEAKGPGFERNTMRTITAGFPDLYAFAYHVNQFNQRKFRHADDALPAISGLLSVFSRSFEGGFLYGIPEMFFERGLCWRSEEPEINLWRRSPSDRQEDERLHPSGLPSWSWIGWSGKVNIGNFPPEAGRILFMRMGVTETIPITQWYTGASPLDAPRGRRKIRSTWFENREKYKGSAKPLPPGWTRYLAPSKFKGQNLIPPDRCGDFVFKHADEPDNEFNTEWYWPFPVADVNSKTPPFVPAQTEYLFCETMKTVVWGRADARYDIRNQVGLYDQNVKRIGILWPHNEHQLRMFEKSTTAEDGLKLPAMSVELVAICKSRNNYIHEGTLTINEIYNVLWVEWDNGVAYRLGSGYVLKEEWEALQLQKILLVLG
ncbi:heterokaryon incompatibility protein-domain-containing protein [Phyllosticta capitalensis]